MSRTVTALYDTRAEAESAKQRLTASFDTDSVKIIDQNSRGDAKDGGSFLSKIFGSHDDQHTFDEGIRRGSFMLCAEVDADEDEERIVSVLEETNSVDLNQRQSQFQSDGWQPRANTQGLGQNERQSAVGGLGASQGAAEEEHIPIVDEQLRVGKRTVSRGGARVRTYVKEVPVEESVNLREEHVSIERRPVNLPLGASALNDDNLFRDKTIEMTATAEEAVVAKEARVKEELVVRKTSSEHTEQIHEVLRHTEIETENEPRQADELTSDRR